MQNAKNTISAASATDKPQVIPTACPMCGGLMVAKNTDRTRQKEDAQSPTAGNRPETGTKTFPFPPSPSGVLLALCDGDSSDAAVKALALEIVARMPADFHRQVVSGSEIAKWLELPEEDLLQPVWTTTVSKNHPAGMNIMDLAEHYEPASDYAPEIETMVKKLIDACPGVYPA